jgi:hypothetical protein
MVAGPRNQNSFPFSSFREPCNHPNCVAFVVGNSRELHCSFEFGSHSPLIKRRVISGLPVIKTLARPSLQIHAQALLVVVKPGVNAGGVGSAATMLGAVGELHDVFAILRRAKFEDKPQADNARAMNANEAGGIQTLFKGLHGFA